MKTAGIILILFSGTGLGLCKSMELTARLKILEKLAQLLLLLKGEIRCTGATLEDAFLDAAAKMPGEYRLFLKETAGWLQQRPGITFDEIFRECAVRLLPLHRLSEEERESFLSLGEKLGYLDREMQVAQLTLLEEELDYRIKIAKAAENISEHGNSGRNSAGSFVVVISYNIWENCLENGYVKADNGKKGGPLGSQYYFQNSCCGDSGLRTFSGPETQRQRGTGFFSQPGRASCGTLLDRTIYL